MKLQILKYALVLLLSTLICEVFATGTLYVRPRFSSQSYEKMWIKTINVDINIQDQVAETKVDQIFFNELNSQVEAIYIFPLPENAMITSMVYWFNGERYTAEIRERAEAVAAYNQKLSQWLDPALLEYLGDNLFRLSIVPVNANSEVRTEITYVELLNYDFGVNRYKFLLNTFDLSSKPLETVYLKMDANSQAPFKYFRSPSHDNSSSTLLTKLSDFNYTVEFGDENFYPEKDFLLEYETERDNVQFNVLTYSPTPEDSMGNESFYSLWITPPDSISENEIIPKNIIFTADVSSSMSGTRIIQLKKSLKEFLNLLTPSDRFNIITFGTHVNKFKPDLIEAIPENVQKAQEFVYQIYALGMTNISAALDSSMNQSFLEGSSNNLIFLTDGKPTIGLKDIDSIVNYTTAMNIKGVRLFSFGIGENLSKTLLTNLSLQNNGYSTYITSDEIISEMINNHFTRISKPIISDLELDYGGLVTLDKYPKIFSDLYWGTQTMEMGLYSQGGNFNVQLNGMIRNEEVKFSKNITFTDTGGYRFVPRLWAKAKINHLLDLIDIHGENEELVGQILDLSLRFQILTKYTAFYSDPDPDITSVNDENIIPDKFTVSQNYPNPFNPTTTIKYSLPAGKLNYHVTIKVYDVLGRLVAVLFNDFQNPGNYSIEFNGESVNQQLSSGIYYYTVTADQFSMTRKMLLIK